MSDTKRIKAEADYKRGMKYKDIAEKYDVSINTVKSWKRRYNWSRNKDAPIEKSVHTKKRGAPYGNQNAVGNEGGAPKGNSNAVTHGFFRKYLPEDALEIMQQIESRSPLDMLWDNIMIQYTAIIRAQQLMFVRDQEDKTVERIEEKGGDSSWGEKWEVQQAWDKHATFLNAQSRAMSTLQSLIKQYEELCIKGLATEEQRLRVEKLKGEVDKMKAENSEEVIENDGFLEALEGKVSEVWDDVEEG